MRGAQSGKGIKDVRLFLSAMLKCFQEHLGLITSGGWGQLLCVTELRKLDLIWPILASSHQSWLWIVLASPWETNDDSNEPPSHRTRLCIALLNGPDHHPATK